jgi:hypothetical protein
MVIYSMVESQDCEVGIRKTELYDRKDLDLLPGNKPLMGLSKVLAAWKRWCFIYTS